MIVGQYTDFKLATLDTSQVADAYFFVLVFTRIWTVSATLQVHLTTGTHCRHGNIRSHIIIILDKTIQTLFFYIWAIIIMSVFMYACMYWT